MTKQKHLIPQSVGWKQNKCSLQTGMFFGYSFLLFSVPFKSKHTHTHTVYTHTHTPQGALMPEVRAVPTPVHANTTCCHSNRGRSQMKPLHLAPLFPHLSLLFSLSTCFFFLVYSSFYLVFSPQSLCRGMKRERERDKGMREANAVGGVSICTWVCVVPPNPHLPIHLTPYIDRIIMCPLMDLREK